MNIRSFALLVLLLTAPTVPAAPAPTGRADSASALTIGDTFTLDSVVLHESRRINVYTARAPGMPADAPLPVMVMPDGGIGEDFLHVAGLLQVGVGNGTVRPFLLIGIENTDRRRDLTGPTEVADDRRSAPRVGGSAAFRAFIRDELMPQIRRRYATTDERAIVGESLAGLFVLETFLQEPGLFNEYFAFDPSLWWNRHRLLDEAAAKLKAQPAGARALYLASSNEPTLADLARQFAAVLAHDAPQGLNWHYEPMPEERHSTIYHPAALRGFRTLLAPAPVP